MEKDENQRVLEFIINYFYKWIRASGVHANDVRLFVRLFVLFDGLECFRRETKVFFRFSHGHFIFRAAHAGHTGHVPPHEHARFTLMIYNYFFSICRARKLCVHSRCLRIIIELITA